MSTQAADRQTTNEPDIAAGATEDTLQACIARIPRDATIGQLMIAQQGCWRDENDRKPFKAIPDARSAAVIDPAERGFLPKSSDRISMVEPNASK